MRNGNRGADFSDFGPNGPSDYWSSLSSLTFAKKAVQASELFPRPEPREVAVTADWTSASLIKFGRRW